MIELKNISKKYNGKVILKNINLTLPSRGFVIITGVSGCGKSTLLNILTGQIKKSNGKIIFFGEKVNKLNQNKIGALFIGEVFQKNYLYEDRTVYENIEISLKIIDLLESFERKAKVDYVIKILGLNKYKNTLCRNLSIGEKMKVQIARSLVKNPKVLALDEPTAPLDKKNAFNLFSLLKEISKQKLVIMVTHDNLALNFADRIITMKKGEIFKDVKNTTTKNKNIEFDGEINLQKFKDKKEYNNITLYGKNNDKLLLVFKDDNIYLKTKKRVIDNVKIIKYSKVNSPKINLDNLDNSLNDIKYTSIYSLSDSIKRSLRKFLGYYKNNKSLIVGLMFSCFIITFFISFIQAKLNKTSVVYYNKNYIRVINNGNLLDNLKTLKPDYIIPENYIKNVEIVNNDLYKLNQLRLKGKTAIVKDKKVAAGECVLSLNVAENILNNASNKSKGAMINIKKTNDLLNKYIIVDNIILKITEISNKSNALFVNNDDFDEIFCLKNIKPISKYVGKITLIEGHLPEYENDAIISESINSDKYNITGRYSGEDFILVSDKTYEKKYFNKPEYYVYTKNKSKLLKKFDSRNIKYYDDYTKELKIKSNEKINSIKSTIKLLSCFLLLSSTIIFFIIRIIITDNKTNIGINKLLKVKKIDNYLFIMTDILFLISSITLFSNLFMMIFLRELVKIEVLKHYFVVNIGVYLISSMIVLLECIIISVYLIRKENKKSGLEILE